MLWFRCLALTASLVLGAMPLAAQQPPAAQEQVEDERNPPIDAALLADLKKGGYLIFFRHGLTPTYADQGGDPSLDTCSAQRNLSKEGIEQSKATGEAFRELDIPVGIVRASPYCRCTDTAWHAFGRFERDMHLRLTGKNPAVDEDAAKRFRNMRNMGKIMPLPGTNSIFISHGDAGEVFGAGYLNEGEAVVVKPDGKGWALIGRVKPDQWRET